MEEKIFNKINYYANDIITSDNFLSTKNYIQHGKQSVYNHCMKVTEVSIKINDKVKLKCNERDLIRGALLHDYFLYDWHIPNEETKKRLHGFYHPSTALRNAKREYDVSKREEEIIKKHMWPLTVIPPTCREAWVVTIADKYCSLLETLYLIK